MKPPDWTARDDDDAEREWERDNLITTNAAAAILGVTRHAILYHVRAGNLAPMKYGPIHLFHRADVDRLAQSPRRKHGRPKRKPAA